MTEQTMNERALAILKLIIERYIRDGQPVGSKIIAEEMVSHSMALSPATIRNIMADLEESGYLTSPHTSAGRVPTRQGYRLFINTLLTVQPLQQARINEIQTQLNSVKQSDAIVEKASNALSTITKLASIVTFPKREHFILRQIEFLPLSGNRILAIIVFNDKEIQNRVIHSDRHYTREELQQAGNYLTQTYAGKEWLSIRQGIFNHINTERQHMQTILQDSLTIIKQAFDEDSKEEKDYVLAGESNLLTLAEQAGVGRLRELFAALSQERIILDLLDACLRTPGIQIFIGQESGYKVFDDCSIVTAPYTVDGKIIGVLSVIGPTRMPYEQVISTVDITAKLLSTALSEPYE